MYSSVLVLKNMRTQTQVNKDVSRALFVRLTKIFYVQELRCENYKEKKHIYFFLLSSSPLNTECATSSKRKILAALSCVDIEDLITLDKLRTNKAS